MTNTSLHSDQVWLRPDAGSFETFLALVQRSADPEDWPMADRIVRNTPIYSGEILRTLTGDARRELMAEWVTCLRTGPGIVVIDGAFADTAPIDSATAIFENLIAQEKEQGKSRADHFAKPGANDRVWNALEKHCLAAPEDFARYYSNRCLATICEAWLGPAYQVTAQVNRVNPGGSAQSAHRDYHLGFMTPQQIARYPAHVHDISPVLTLQGAIAHCDMPLQSGPTQFLPFSQMYFEGYLAFARPEFQAHFDENHVQLPLKKGDAVFFNPALMHGAGSNTSSDIYRMANLLQISSGFGRALEAVDRTAISKAVYPALRTLRASGDLTADELDAAICASGEGYPFPTNLDRDPPVGGLAPLSQQDHMRQALASDMAADDFARLMDTLVDKRQTG